MKFLYSQLPSLQSLKSNTSWFPDFLLVTKDPEAHFSLTVRALETCRGSDRDPFRKPDQSAAVYFPQNSFQQFKGICVVGGRAEEGQGEGVKLGECRQFSNPAIGVLSVLIEALERIPLVWGGFMQSPPRDRSGSFILHFKKSFWTTFFMLSSVLGMEAVTEYAVGTALKELII